MQRFGAALLQNVQFSSFLQLQKLVLLMTFPVSVCLWGGRRGCAVQHWRNDTDAAGRRR